MVTVVNSALVRWLQLVANCYYYRLPLRLLVKGFGLEQQLLVQLLHEILLSTLQV
jgi:hypothetical protein